MPIRKPTTVMALPEVSIDTVQPATVPTIASRLGRHARSSR